MGDTARRAVLVMHVPKVGPNEKVFAVKTVWSQCLRDAVPPVFLSGVARFKRSEIVASSACDLLQSRCCCSEAEPLQAGRNLPRLGWR